jgi:four helix bundle protein
MLKPVRDPFGFKKLLVYQKTDELQKECSLLTSRFPHSNSHLTPLKTLYSLSDQMNRSARSVKQNIVEGWKRNSTDEYYQFLGFSIGACAELEEDFNDIWKGRYPELMEEKGIMGETHSIPFQPPFDIEKLKFYPLDRNLPPVVQLKLRCKEINFLLEKLQKSLKEKMGNEGTMTSADKFKLLQEQQRKEKQFEEELLKKYGKKWD